jgi:hypothetical protein
MTWLKSTATGNFALAVLLVLTSCSPAPQTSESFSPNDEWREFRGTWTAAGGRHTIQFGIDRRATIADFNGSLLLSGPSRPAIGFRAEAVVLSDSSSGMIGRAVWSDERGDKLFSELKGESAASGKRILGTFVGGTGRYSCAEGSYEFSWLFELEGEDGKVQGQSIGLHGQVRVGSTQGTSRAGGPQS